MRLALARAQVPKRRSKALLRAVISPLKLNQENDTFYTETFFRNRSNWDFNLINQIIYLLLFWVHRT